MGFKHSFPSTIKNSQTTPYVAKQSSNIVNFVIGKRKTANTNLEEINRKLRTVYLGLVLTGCLHMNVLLLDLTSLVDQNELKETCFLRVKKSKP